MVAKFGAVSTVIQLNACTGSSVELLLESHQTLQMILFLESWQAPSVHTKYSSLYQVLAGNGYVTGVLECQL